MSYSINCLDMKNIKSETQSNVRLLYFDLIYRLTHWTLYQLETVPV